MPLTMQVLGVMAAFFALAGPVFAQTTAAAPVETCSRTEADGSRTLCHAVVLDAAPAEVWRLVSTSEGLSSWAAPLAAIDLRIGGMWESSYAADARLGDEANIRNRVVAFAPERMLVIQIADAPPGFPHEDLGRQLTTVIELEPLGARQTRVRVTMLGFRDGEGFDALHGFFDGGNALTLAQLYERVGRPS